MLKRSILILFVMLSAAFTAWGQDKSGSGNDEAIRIQIDKTQMKPLRQDTTAGESATNGREATIGQDSIHTRILPRRSDVVPGEKDNSMQEENPNLKQDSGLRELDLKDPIQQYQLGKRFYVGDKYIVQDEKLAVEWWTKSAEQGYTPAQNQLGICYRYGYGVEQDDKKAVYWWKKASDKGYRDAMMNLGNCYAFGLGVEEDDTMAVRLFELTATTGPYMLALAQKYQFGDGIKMNGKKAIYWNEKAAEHREVDAMYNLGYMYYNGKQITQDYEKAFYWWKKGADIGDAQCAHQVAVCYKEGIGVKPNKRKYEHYFDLAAGLSDVEAMIALGYAYYYGEVRKKDDKKAFKWMERAAEKGIAEAQYCLGVFYNFGVGVKADENKAIEWVKRAAIQNYPDALKALGMDVPAQKKENE